MNILGLKIAGHDTGAALSTDKGVVAIAEERLTREKHTSVFPELSIQYCLDGMGLVPGDIDMVVLDHTSKVPGKTSAEVFAEKTQGLFSRARVEMIGHHESHAAAAFFCSPFEKAAILIYDGNGDFFPLDRGVIAAETETLYRGEGTTITLIDKVMHVKSKKQFPYSSGIGILYQTLSKDYIGFGLNNEGKMMGLAAYGDDSFLRMFPYERWVRDYFGRLICNSRILFSPPSVASRVSKVSSVSPKVVYWGARMYAKQWWRNFSSRFSSDTAEAVPKFFESIRMPRPARDPAADRLPDKYYSSVAYAAQKIFEKFSIDLGTRLRTITGSDRLCVSGGCALNIDANRNFLDVVGFKDLFVQPASSDCGIALGCALWGRHAIAKLPRSWEMKNASLGRAYSVQDIDAAIAERREEVEWKVSEHIAAETAELLADKKIIGWFQGGSEYGPRALGNRSIICDPRGKDARDILNARVKHREMWRPFAASVLLDKMSQWFEIDVPSPFMLLMAPVHQAKQSVIPSVVHVDGTCRLQSLTKEDNGRYWEVVNEFDKLTGTPLILNTSFNLGGDPIVESPRDAIDTFLRTDMDYLVLEDRIVRKRVSPTP